MFICKSISNNINFDCNFPMQSGTKDKGYIINFNDVLDVIYNASNKMIVEEIVLKPNAIIYYVDGRNNSIMPTFNLIKNAFTDVFDHIVNVKGFDISPEAKENLQGSVSGLFIFIAENNFKGSTGNSAFEVYGLNSGLEITLLTRDANNTDTQGAFDITFSTNKNKEPFIPKNIFIVSYEATKLYIETLLSVPVVGDFNNDFNNDFN